MIEGQGRARAETIFERHSRYSYSYYFNLCFLSPSTLTEPARIFQLVSFSSFALTRHASGSMEEQVNRLVQQTWSEHGPMSVPLCMLSYGCDPFKSSIKQHPLHNGFF